LIQNFRYKGSPPPIIFAWLVRPMNALQLCRWQFSHKKNFVADFLQAKCDFTRKSAVLRFWDFPLGDLGATYDNPLRLIWKIPISVNWTFFVRCYGWGATGEYRLKIGEFAPTGWQTDGRTDRPTELSSLDRVCIPCIAVKNIKCGHKSVYCQRWHLFGRREIAINVCIHSWGSRASTYYRWHRLGKCEITLYS